MTASITYSFIENQFVRLYCGRPETCIYTVDEAAKKLVTSLTPKERTYITDPARGEYRGFAALHDLCDANMRLPGCDEYFTENALDAYTDFCNALMDRFNALLLPA